jgi:hypothetical protein
VKSWKEISIVALMAISAGCSKPDPVQPVKLGNAVEKTRPEVVKSPNGLAYAVERVTGFDISKAPQNSDLKMADGDLAKYAIEACSLDVAVKYAPERCDVYVQPDRAGTLVGYAFVSRDAKGAHFQTVTTLNEQKQPGGGACYLSGTIYDDKSNGEKAVADPSRDFTGRQMYSVTKNGSGAELVSEVDPNDTAGGGDGSWGVWYITKEGDKLRIAQERWNYCYKDDNVNVDDVYYRAVSLVRVAQ